MKHTEIYFMNWSVNSYSYPCYISTNLLLTTSKIEWYEFWLYFNCCKWVQEMRDESSEYVYLSEGHNNYEEELALANGASHLFAFQLQPNQPNLHGFRFNSHDLSLAWLIDTRPWWSLNFNSSIVFGGLFHI